MEAARWQPLRMRLALFGVLRAQACIFLQTKVTPGLRRRAFPPAPEWVPIASIQCAFTVLQTERSTSAATVARPSPLQRRRDFPVLQNSKLLPVAQVTSGWREATKVARTVCGTQQILAPTSPNWRMYKKPTTLVLECRPPVKLTWPFTPVRRSTMSAVSIVRMTLVPLGCELMMTYTNTDLRVGQSLATRECTDAFMWVQTGAALSLVIRVDNRHRHLHLLQHRRRRRHLHLLQLQHQVPLPLPLRLRLRLRLPLQRRRRRPISLCQQTQRRSLLIVVLTLPVISRS